MRSIDSENIDKARFCHEINQFSNMLFNNGLDNLARLIFQEASKHHIFLSQYQRPVLPHTREMETKMVWEVEQFQLSTFYRYTDQYKLAQLVDFLPTMKKEALEATKHINEVGK